MPEDIDKKDIKNGGYSVGGGRYLDEDTHLRDHLQVISKHRLMVAATFVVIVITVAIRTFATTPVYTATTTIQIDKEPLKVLKFEDGFPIDGRANDYYPTQRKVIQSRAIAMKVIDKLALWEHPQFQEKNSAGEARASLVDLDNIAREKVTGSFSKLLGVEFIKESRIATISFSSEYPDLSADVANQIAQSYIDYNLESKYKATEKARDWLSVQLELFQTKIEISEEALHSFARRHGIFSLEKDENLAVIRLEELSVSFSIAESDRIAKESFYRKVSQYSPETIVVAQSLDSNNGEGFSLINDLKRELSALESQYQKQLKLYKPDYPDQIRLKAQIESLNERLKQEIGNLVKVVEVAYKVSLERENLLKGAFYKQKELAMVMKERGVQYNILKREVDTNKELYDGLLQRVKETGVSAGLESSNIQVIDRAVVPRSPSKPDKGRNIFLSMVMGLFIGVGLAFFREYFDNTIKDPDEITRLFNLPTLGLIPLLESTLQKKGRKDVDHGHGVNPSVEDMYLISRKFPRSSISEACRTFRTSLLFSAAGRPPKTILITSSNPKEGKTFLSCNLGIVLAQSGAKTLIVDADFRRPFCHKIFSIPSTPGMTDYLTGHSTLKEMIASTDVDGLYVLPAGPICPNPPELLDSKEFKETIEELKGEYDFIVFDSAPVMHFADTLNLANKVDGTVLVINSGKTTKDGLSNSIGLMTGINAHILGVVINALDISKSNYYYNYYHYYGEGAEKGVESGVS